MSVAGWQVAGFVGNVLAGVWLVGAVILHLKGRKGRKAYLWPIYVGRLPRIWADFNNVNDKSQVITLAKFCDKPDRLRYAQDVLVSEEAPGSMIFRATVIDVYGNDVVLLALGHQIRGDK